MKGYQALAEAVAAEGVDTVFRLLGDGNTELVNEFVYTHGMRFVAARHELAALTMADAYSRASGRLGVLQCHPRTRTQPHGHRADRRQDQPLACGADR